MNDSQATQDSTWSHSYNFAAKVFLNIRIHYQHLKFCGF